MQKDSTNPIMLELKKKLGFIAGLIPNKHDVIYLDYPFHLNVGDLLIYHGTEKFFKNYGISIKLRRPWTLFNVEELRDIVTSETTILCHGGGNFGDLYSVAQDLREAVVKHFPGNRVIVLPQTAFFKNKENISLSAEIFSQHPDCHLFARDQATFDLMGQFSKNVYLSPDMAHQLYGSLKKQPYQEGMLLYFLRRDMEKSHIETKLIELVKNNKNVNVLDWSDVVRSSDNLLWRIQYYLALSIRNTHNIKIKNYYDMYWYKKSKTIIDESSLIFSQYSHITTTRLHGHILSCLLDIPNTVYDNSYGKNKGYYDLWTHPIENTCMKTI